ncbi:MAG TPA: F0F1 ATP synthase subunit A [Acidimicrobiia bacterium]|nr:F0F1 ATP synthase subunit A [Acidimicrobiia bacterium]
MDQVILAFECHPEEVALCVPASILELFELPVLFGVVNRTVVYILLAALVVMAVLYFAYRKPRVVPTRFGVAVESLVRFVKEDIAIGVIGPGGEKYAPYLLSLFLFILVGNFFGLTPFINFPLGSRMAIPLFLALLTWVIFVFMGIKKQGLGYIGHLLWPPGVPVALKPLIGIIEFVSTIIVRPFSLAVRLFANLVAGHTMLALLLGTAIVFWVNIGNIGLLKGGLVGSAWFILGMAIFVLEMLVLFLQAYIFTLLSAVYIESSLHPAH